MLRVEPAFYYIFLFGNHAPARMIKLTFVLSTDSDERFLTPKQASRVYDRIGSFQDWQIYEREPIRELVRLGSFHSAEAVFEFGCGTGAFAAMLLRTQLPSDSRNVGINLSPKMVWLATSRLATWSERAEVRLSDGSSRLPERTVRSTVLFRTTSLICWLPNMQRPLWPRLTAY